MASESSAAVQIRLPTPCNVLYSQSEVSHEKRNGPSSVRTRRVRLGIRSQQGPLLVRIENVSFGGKLSYGDVVEAAIDEHGILAAGKRVSQMYKRKTAIYYDTVPQFRALSKKLRKLGAASEGAVGPAKDNRGIMVVSYNKGVDPVAAAKEVGIAKPRSRNVK